MYVHLYNNYFLKSSIWKLYFRHEFVVEERWNALLRFIPETIDMCPLGTCIAIECFMSLQHFFTTDDTWKFNHACNWLRVHPIPWSRHIFPLSEYLSTYPEENIHWVAALDVGFDGLDSGLGCISQVRFPFVLLCYHVRTPLAIRRIRRLGVGYCICPRIQGQITYLVDCVCSILYLSSHGKVKLQ